MIFVYDNLNSTTGRPIPNLADPASNNYDLTWPHTVELRLLSYFDRAGLSYAITDQVRQGWYPIAFSWFDFSVDYLKLVPETVLNSVLKQQTRFLFYYHEGDNPERIKTRLDELCTAHSLPLTYLFVSANTQAQHLERCVYFDDHASFFARINRHQKPETAPDPVYDFTLLNRYHKNWRATFASQLWATGALDNSLFSYNTVQEPVTDTDLEDNPVELSRLEQGFERYTEFLKSQPYYVDSQDSTAHNHHAHVNTTLYSASKLHLVAETHFDNDQSSGVFLTEKTYKCIKFGQPFVIASAPGSIEYLRSQGYRVADTCIDHSYDAIVDNTLRMKTLLAEIARLKTATINREDALHNQRVFLSQCKNQVSTLYKELL